MTAALPPPPTVAERAHLAAALAIATRVRGTTAPNPGVGCVVVRDGRVVGTGVTAPVGGPHAEVVALREAGEAARGATVHVTLEPCAHHGRTPPCTDALLAAGVGRVVVGLRDPHAVAAGGVEVLRRAGVEVAVADGLLREAIAGELEGFLRAVTDARPQLTLKLAQTADGALVAAGTGATDRAWITGPAARRAVHRWRGAVDAVLVGIGTVLADDPGLDVRDVPLGGRPQPRPVVVDTSARTSPTSRVVQRHALILTGPTAPAGATAALTAAGAEVVALPAASTGGVHLDAALTALVDRGVLSVLAEPGSGLARALLAADLVDRVVLHVAPPEEAPGAAGAAPVALHPAVELDPDRWRPVRLGGAGRDLIAEAVRVGR